ncbi:hypothetical protein ACOMHN_020721 [Nucella lapillus]
MEAQGEGQASSGGGDQQQPHKDQLLSSEGGGGGGGSGGGGGGGGGGGDISWDVSGGKGNENLSKKSSKRGFLRRHKSKQYMSGNGFPNLVPEALDAASAFIPSIDSSMLSPQTDRTYNEMLQNRMSNHQTSFSRIHSKNSIQSRIYNFLERPTGWKCFIYHFTV